MEIISTIFKFIITITLSFCSLIESNNTVTTYKPINKDLLKEITAMDKLFFDAYNTCDLEKQKKIYSNAIEFFHDKAGLETSREKILASTKKYICGKVTRELVKGSIEVYPIDTYGAVEIGYHKFYNNKEPDAISKASKFIIMWKKEKEQWHITKVISLH